MAAGEFGGEVLETVAHLDAVGEFLCAPRPLRLGDAEVEHRHLDVLQHAELGDEVEALEDEAEVLEAVVGKFVVRHARHVHAVEQVAAGRGAGEAEI